MVWKDMMKTILIKCLKSNSFNKACHKKKSTSLHQRSVKATWKCFSVADNNKKKTTSKSELYDSKILLKFEIFTKFIEIYRN